MSRIMLLILAIVAQTKVLDLSSKLNSNPSISKSLRKKHQNHFVSRLRRIDRWGWCLGAKRSSDSNSKESNVWIAKSSTTRSTHSRKKAWTYANAHQDINQIYPLKRRSRITSHNNSTLYDLINHYLLFKIQIK